VVVVRGDGRGEVFVEFLEPVQGKLSKAALQNDPLGFDNLLGSPDAMPVVVWLLGWVGEFRADEKGYHCGDDVVGSRRFAPEIDRRRQV